MIELYLSLFQQRLGQIMQRRRSQNHRENIRSAWLTLRFSPKLLYLGMNEQLSIVTARPKIVIQVEKHLREGSSAQTQTYS